MTHALGSSGMSGLGEKAAGDRGMGCARTSQEAARHMYWESTMRTGSVGVRLCPVGSWLLVTDDAVASVEQVDQARMSGSWLILSRWQVVIFEPREVIVKRVAADRVIAAVELTD